MTQLVALWEWLVLVFMENDPIPGHKIRISPHLCYENVFAEASSICFA